MPPTTATPSRVTATIRLLQRRKRGYFLGRAGGGATPVTGATRHMERLIQGASRRQSKLSAALIPICQTQLGARSPPEPQTPTRGCAAPATATPGQIVFRLLDAAHLPLNTIQEQLAHASREPWNDHLCEEEFPTIRSCPLQLRILGREHGVRRSKPTPRVAGVEQAYKRTQSSKII